MTAPASLHIAGHVAKLISMPSYSRHVGQGTILLLFPFGTALTCPTTALKFLSPAADPPVQWQRVVSSAGRISLRGPSTDGAARQGEALQGEDVEVHVGRTNELLVDLATYGWFPAPGTISP
jgi:methylated-DNA-protein-cysteine methyltransferase-like protein